MKIRSLGSGRAPSTPVEALDSQVVLRTLVRVRAAAAGLVALVVVLVATGSAAANSRPAAPPSQAAVPGPLLDAARANPSQIFDVIVQGRGRGSSAVTGAVREVAASGRATARGVKRQFGVVDAVAAQVTGAQLVELAARPDVFAVTKDQLMTVAGGGGGSSTCSTCPFQGVYWPQLAGVAPFMPSPSKNALPVPQAPAIAIVDSGIEGANTFFGGRVAAEIDLTTAGNNSPSDGYGHGTFVAGLAGGRVGNWGGASPTSKLVSLDVVDDDGRAVMSDVIAAADWIYQNKDAYRIRVANFSLTGTEPTSFMFDPLDKAVERLWFSGVVVVAAAGNYGSETGPSGALYAPANDPFVITVGATDMNQTLDATDDFAAPWSAYGATPDGFLKPEISAPGRYMMGTVPRVAAMPRLRPDRIVADGWMWMSGTSFAAPVLAGAAADVLAVHPTWTPDQVKGALMLTARPLRVGPQWRGGVGQVKTDAAAAVVVPPNPNLALNGFLVADPDGGATKVFDAAAWSATATANPLWSTASWTTASWTTASWTTASWTTASWTTASWTTASWTTASWTTGGQATDGHATEVQPALAWAD
jgi:serine protease AprX